MWDGWETCRHAQSWAWLTSSKVGMGQGARPPGWDGVGFSLPTRLVIAHLLHGLRQLWHGPIGTKCLGSGRAFGQAWKVHDGASDRGAAELFSYFVLFLLSDTSAYASSDGMDGWVGGNGWGMYLTLEVNGTGRDGMAWHGITTLSLFFVLFSRFTSFLLSSNPTTMMRHAEEHPVFFYPSSGYPSCPSALVGTRFRGSQPLF